MARTIRSPKLDTRSARAKLPVRREPYWAALAPGRHLGYRRLGLQGGTWLAKQRDPKSGQRRHRALGPADDVLDSSKGVLTFAAAQESARTFFESSWDDEPAPPTPAPYTVRKALADYLEWLGKYRKSALSARHKAEANILTQLGEIAVDDLTTRQIRAWLEGIANSPRLVRSGKGRGPRTSDRYTLDDPEARRARRATANRVWTTLRAALNRAWREGHVGSNIAWKSIKPLPQASAARVRWLTEDECRRLLNACEPDFRGLVRAALLTGCRYGELGRLRCGDVDLEAHALHVRDSKAGKPRWVPLDDDALAFVTAAKLGHPADAILLPRGDGRPWGTTHQQRPLAAAAKAAGIPAVNFHALRHTWASHRVMRGAPLLVVAQVLGHADTRMVERHYGHLAPSYVRDVIRGTAGSIGSGVERSVVPMTLPQRSSSSK